MDETFADEDSLDIVKRLVTDIGTPQLVQLIADAAQQQANELLRQGASPRAARFARDATILRRACKAILDCPQ